jgi:hypothetical protein
MQEYDSSTKPVALGQILDFGFGKRWWKGVDMADRSSGNGGEKGDNQMRKSLVSWRAIEIHWREIGTRSKKPDTENIWRLILYV